MEVPTRLACLLQVEGGGRGGNLVRFRVSCNQHRIGDWLCGVCGCAGCVADLLGVFALASPLPPLLRQSHDPGYTRTLACLLACPPCLLAELSAGARRNERNE